MAQQFTQGNITVTENPMDLAVNGNGFFQVSDGKNPTMYTRNGQFKVDKDGYIVTNHHVVDGARCEQRGLAAEVGLAARPERAKFAVSARRALTGRWSAVTVGTRSRVDRR